MTGAPMTTPERVDGDDVTGRGDVDTHAPGDVGQHAHGHELGGADREAAHGQRDDRDDDPAGGEGWAFGRRRSGTHSYCQEPVPGRHSRRADQRGREVRRRRSSCAAAAARRGEPAGSQSRQACQTTASSRASGSWA